ncbi:MAG: S-layer homology domain-containing protein [Candidatus Margulisbacteria bacterium]|nr:S-layer homology domain-containing protein [Candidatus Margulisiibacteriota bacterium]
MVIGHSAFALNGTTVDPGQNLFAPRQLGMGGVGAAFGGDANALFTNPSGLTGIEFPQLTSASRKLLADETQYNIFAWAVPTSYGTFGLGYAGLGVSGSLPTYLDPATGRILINPSQEAGSYDNSVIALSYSRRLSTFTLGGNLKLFNQALSGGGYSDRGTGLGLDLGAGYKMNHWLNVGANLSNILGGSIKWANTEDKLGANYKLGLAANVLGATGEALNFNAQSLKAGFDLDLPVGLYHLGLEYSPVKNIALRGGINQEAAGSGLTLGIGLTNNGFRFDYAYYQRPGIPGDTPHYFSLSYVGDRILTYDRKLKKKEVKFRVLHPKDRLITDLAEVDLTAEGYAELLVDQKRTWTVPGLSATSDAFNVTTTEALLAAYVNNRPVADPNLFTAKEPLRDGRNVINLLGFVSGEAGSGEVRVLRITPFKDTPVSFWAIEPIALCGVLGLVYGYPDDTFKPERGITRAELVTVLVKTLPIRAEELTPLASEEIFTDVSRKHWAAKYIVFGNREGYVTGYQDGKFQPNKVLTRAEGIALLARYAKLAEETGLKEPPFSDLKADFWANKYIEPAKKAGMLKYLAGKEFRPAEPFSRAEACEVLYQVPNIQKRANEWWDTGVVSAAHP